MLALLSANALGYCAAWQARNSVHIIWGSNPQHDVKAQDPADGNLLLPLDFSDSELRAEMACALRMTADQGMQLGTGPVIIAKSELMLDLLREASAYAVSDHNVLIGGETGVGKELIARVVHEGHGRYSKGPFVPVNCGAVPEGLFESLFFGHVRGAFTGALQAHKGYLEQADGGTLFLDELGELPLFQQVKLLRVLEGGSVTRVGSERPVRVDFRLIAATNRNLSRMVQQETFRADLFYRIAVIQLAVPSMEERGAIDKIEIFRNLVWRAIGPINGEGPGAIPDWLTDRIAKMHFPGNVRQLKNLAERVSIVVQQTGQWNMLLIGRALQLVQDMEPSTKRACTRPLDVDERIRILDELGRNGWRRQMTANQLGISRKSLWERMRKHGIEDTDKPDSLPAV